MEIAPFYAIISVILISLISLTGVLTLWVTKERMMKILFVLVAFGTGTLLGAAFFHIMPEAVEMSGSTAFTYILFGIVLFFFIERFIQWHHCHRLPAGEECGIKSYTYMNLIGDAVHNFTDGAIVMAAFLADFNIGIITAFAIALHEIPQEISDFGILVHGGFGRNNALFYNLLSGLVAVVGAISIYMISGFINSSIPFLIAIGAGSFLYLASTDLMPEMHREMGARKVVIQFIFMVIGILLMWFLVGGAMGGHLHIH